MTMQERYFNWLLDQVKIESNFSSLMKQLHGRTFIAIMPMDENRIKDGTDLRYRFGYEEELDDDIINHYLFRDKGCSILEMMIGLALRCEETIMVDPELGDRTGFWFWNMISSLGLDEMTNDIYNPEIVDDILTRFIDRKYKPNGEGSLYTIYNFDKDLRDIDIWYQMQYYLDNL